MRDHNEPAKRPPFPLESIFPGIHRPRPDIERAEAEAFLASGNKQQGVDLSNPATRERLLHARPFQEFCIHPVPPEIEKLLSAIPSDWQQNCPPSVWARVQATENAVAKHFDLPDTLTVEVDDELALWVRNRIANAASRCL